MMDKIILRDKYEISPNGCWEWRAGIDRNGYGRVSINGKYQIASRVSYSIFTGDPSGLLVCHSCDNPTCINPAHLFLGTYKDNYDDMVAKGRRKSADLKGSRNPNSKLDEATVSLIRAAYGSQSAIGKQFGVSQRTVSRIRNGSSWQHIKEAQDG